jgi:hypothetical protein
MQNCDRLLSLKCSSYKTGKSDSGRHTIVLGDATADQILLKGHVTNSELNFDANGDGVMLRLKFSDPAKTTSESSYLW